tara:strand:+ start:17397 stop:18113 length:717 start_codon:yes stop_codon:yes gene_type:complete
VTSIKEIYDEFIGRINENKQLVRYSGKEEWLHSSSAGLCMRKHSFSTDPSIIKPKHDNNTLRLFRLGDIVHTDIQNAAREWADQEGKPIFIEKELFIENFRVRGFIDLAIVDDGCLYDIKTCNSWKFKNIDDEGDVGNYALQLGTYGLWFLENYGHLDRLGLIYYNKDNSNIKEIYLDLDSILPRVKEYWEEVNEFLDKKELPPISLGTSPVYKWECNKKYCQYFEVCGGGIKGVKNE